MTKRVIGFLAVAFALGVGTGYVIHAYLSSGREQAAAPSDNPAERMADANQKDSSRTKGLYTDDEARRILENWTAADAEDPSFLRVVPDGKTAPLETVLSALRVDADRLGEPTANAFMHVEYLVWRLSPSYDLSMMTASHDPFNLWMIQDFHNAGRMVYGIRILKRERG
jgi:hypothetical protein